MTALQYFVMSVIRMMHLCSDCLSEWAGLSDEDLFLANWWNSHLRPKSLIASQLIRVRVLWSNSDHLQRRPQSFVQAGDEALGELHLHPGTDTQNSNCFKIIFSNFLVCGEDFWASQLDCVHWETLRLLLLCWQAGEWASGEGEHKSVERHIAQCHQDFDQFLKLNTKSPVTDASTCAHWSRNKLSWQNCTVTWGRARWFFLIFRIRTPCFDLLQCSGSAAHFRAPSWKFHLSRRIFWFFMHWYNEGRWLLKLTII